DDELSISHPVDVELEYDGAPACRPGGSCPGVVGPQQVPSTMRQHTDAALENAFVGVQLARRGHWGQRTVRDSQDDGHGDQGTKEAHRYACRKAPTWRRPRKRLVPRSLARAAVPTRPEEVGRHQGAPAHLAEAVVRRGQPYAAGGAASDHRRSVVGTE